MTGSNLAPDAAITLIARHQIAAALNLSGICGMFFKLNGVVSRQKFKAAMTIAAPAHLSPCRAT
jgi:hypothetical protein